MEGSRPTFPLPGTGSTERPACPNPHPHNKHLLCAGQSPTPGSAQQDWPAWWAWPTLPVPSQAPGTHSQVVLPCMLTTHLASWLVSRALKGRTLTATFTEAPVMAPNTPTLLSWRTETEEVVRPAGGTHTLPPSFSKKPVSPSPIPQLPNPSSTQFLVPWPSSQTSLLRDSQRCFCLSP